MDKYKDKLENIYAIGGTSIFKKALEYPSGFLDRIYLTRVYSPDSECDVFLESNYLDNFTKLTKNIVDNNNDNEYNVIFNEINTENNKLEYVFEIYERN